MVSIRRVSIKVRQNDTSDCGAAALASVAAHAGIRSSVAMLRHLSGTDSSGTTIKGLIEAANAIGLGAEAFRGTVQSLSMVPKPAILHIKKENGILHYVVLTKSSKNKFHVMDPADGQIHKKDIKTICSEWSGILVLFTLPDQLRSKVSIFTPHIRELFRLTISRWKIFPATMAISVVSTASMLAVAVFIKELLDSVIPGGDLARLKTFTLALVALTLTSIILSSLRSCLLVKAGIGIEKELTGEYMEQLCHIPLPFYGSFKTGELTSRISDIYRIRSFIAETLPDTLIAAVSLSLSFFLLFWINSTMAWICMLFLPVYLSVFIIHDKVRKPGIRRLLEKGAAFQGYLIENLRAMATIRNFGLRKRFMSGASIKHNALAKELVTTSNAAIIAGSCADLASRVLSVVILWFGGKSVVAGTISAGEMVSFFTMASLFSSPMQQLAISFAALREGVTASSRFNDIMMVRRERYNTGTIEASNSTIEVKELSFGYPGRDILFRGLSFSIEKGKIVLLTGESGCGKSTVISLILKHLVPSSGTIGSYMDKSSNIEKWREQIALVPQNPELLGDSIMECIIPGDPGKLDGSYFSRLVSELELDKMASRFPFGFSTHPGEGGSLLSRGEQQRVAYARAVMKRAPVMLLDEATASLDNYSRELILNSLSRLRDEGCAILIVSHEKSISRVADLTIDMGLYSCKTIAS
jgi:ATP-binding cassette subfamily B protein